MSQKQTPATPSPAGSGSPLKSGGSGGHYSAGEGATSGTRDLTRRSLLALGGLAGIGLVVGAIAIDSRVTEDAKGTLGQASTKTLAFASTDLTTARWTVTQTGATAPGFLFATPQTAGSCAVISANSGQPVWLAPAGAGTSNLQVQQLGGEPVLTFWSGTRVRGYGSGVGIILDSSYRQIAEVHAAPGLQADLHEFQITPRGTALLIAYTATKADLSAVHGRSSGYLLDCRVNEVDIATGKVLLDWSAREHIPLEETYASVHSAEDGDGSSSDAAFDAYHLNSIDYDDDSLYVSARNTHTVYRIGRTSGSVLWRLGGKKSDFRIAKDAVFAWQNDFRLRPNGMASMFNNRSRDPKDAVRSAAFLLNLDHAARTATLQKKFENGPMLSIDMGSAQLLGNGNWLVGWGTQPVITEHAPDGKIIYTATLADFPSDRAYRSEWAGTPAEAPSIEIARGDGANMLVGVSWNGATDVTAWQFFRGETPNSLQPVKIVPTSDFETIGTLPRAPYAAAHALSVTGAVLAKTAVASST